MVTNYTYKVMILPIKGQHEEGYEIALSMVLDQLGSEGWELVTVDNSVAYFKKPILLSLNFVDPYPLGMMPGDE